jgi:hypothetical protein
MPDMKRISAAWRKLFSLGLQADSPDVADKLQLQPRAKPATYVANYSAVREWTETDRSDSPVLVSHREEHMSQIPNLQDVAAIKPWICVLLVTVCWSNWWIAERLHE